MIDEYCPICETEVELLNKFIPQICPNCGNKILPCSIYIGLEVEGAKVCSICPLEEL